MAESYSKYFNLEFESFSLEQVLAARQESTGFFLSTVFQKRFSDDVNLKRHEDQKLWIQSKNLRFLVLDGIQKSPGTSGLMESNSVLYLLVFFDADRISENGFEDLCQIILKRYDLSSLILKLPINDYLEIWNKGAQKKLYKQVAHENVDTLLKILFDSIHKKDHFQFVGIEKVESTEKKGLFLLRRGFTRAIA